MIVFKPAAALLALGLSGFLGVTAQGPLGASSGDGADNAPRQQPAPPTQAGLPDYEALRLSAQAAMRERVARDLDEPKAEVTLPRIEVDRTSLRSLEARGEGVVRLPGARDIPIVVTAIYDLVDDRIEAVDYTATPVEAELSPVDQAVRAAIGQRIGARIAGDFAGQPTRFALLDVARVDYAEHRTRLQGTGITDFGAEGQAYTPFVAILDKHTGEVVELDYELLQEDPTPTVAGL